MKAASFAGVLLALVSCGKSPQETTKPADPAEVDDVLLRAGQVTITQADLDHHLKEKHAGRADAATREKALEELARRASFCQAAIEAGLDADPLVRAEFDRLLTSRLREAQLVPRLKEASKAVPESRLRELYQEQIDRFKAPEKRQVAVLWLNPGADPARVTAYQEKLAYARDWVSKDESLKDHPDLGFSVLGVDYSEHAASRFKGGVVGWLERGGGMDSWDKAVAEIAFSLKEAGDVSPVITNSEGVFLVRLMALKPAEQRSFEVVSAELERTERQRMMKAIEQEFDDGVLQKHPVEWLKK